MLRTLLLASAALSLAACGGEVTDGGTGSDTDFEEIEAMQGEGVPEPIELAEGGGDLDPGGQLLQEGVAAATRPGDPRPGDYPAPGEEQTRNPIEPGNEEPGGKDMVLQEEYEAMGFEVPSTMRAPLERARRSARGPVAEHQGKLYLSRRGVSLDQLGRAPVLDARGEDDAELYDVLVTPRGELVAFVVEEPDVLGVPGERRLVTPERVAYGRVGEDGPLSLRVGSGLEAMPEFDEDQVPAGAMLVSDLLRQAVRVGEDSETGAIADIVLRADGSLYGFAINYVGQRYLVEPELLVLAQGDGGYELTIDEEQLRQRMPFVGVPAYEAR